ncbi:TolB family protein [Hymenobacter cheonanensis]|uniref:TolB family protein n=1 Tax=Hymenobacter sp. CA2-7 TaxID=3063993 RepID=UPI002712DA51|nr:biopolymer transporter TolR [Hymenobacter sp. CA2-7]MDO7887297.1 biopolymer transporter TolR [Hymenobacter sp. CA2-7]
MKFFASKLLFLFFCLVLAQAGFAQQLGVFDGQQDVGDTGKPGAATYLPATQQYVVTGAGANIWAEHDAFHYVYKKLTGDFLLYARAGLVGWRGAESHRKMGWMVRQSLAPNSPHVSAAEHGDGLTSLQYRKTAGATTEETRASTTQADIIQLERTGTTYTMRVAQFGQPFEVVQVTNVDLGQEVYVGLFVCAHNADVTETAVFRDVRLVVPAPASMVAYKQYLGSHLEVLDVASGNREIIYTAPNSIQAPNWRPDSKSLIYNSDGLMYNFDLATRQPAVLPTGDVKNNNNDHVLSFGGQFLGLSSGVDKLGGSIVYTVPASGGMPRQITPRGPSYLHGWSPDGKSLLFTGQRHDDFDIYRVPAKGGKEVRLTTAKGLDDGPEYTPDGQYIYFNSARSGTMQIWRMRPDGSQQEPVTTGEFNDWFPHISPDGKWLVFVSFLKDEVPAGDHPFYKHVYLRMMPLAGGAPKVIAYVYGGQGTINTPSWSPDSKRVAFISNSDPLK